MKSCYAALALMTGLVACQDSSAEPAGLVLSFGSYDASPVVLLDVSVNGVAMAKSPVVAERSDTETPRTTGSYLLDFPPTVLAGDVVVSVSWVELFTQKAWQAEVTAPLSALVRDAGTDSVRIGPVFGPNGLMILTSDPIPTSATDIPLVDVARMCGSRLPGADFDYTVDPGELGITDLLQFTFPPVTTPECRAQD
jgi:hypothetical protein